MVLDTTVPGTAVPDWLTGFIDDAATLPPASVPLDRAVAEHCAHRRSAYAGLVGGLVVTDLKVPDLIDVLDDGDTEEHEEPLAVSLLVTGGAGAIGPAIRWASRAPLLRMRSLHLALRDEDDLAHNARRVLTALDAVAEDLSEVEVYVEVPRWQDGRASHGWLSALDELAAGEVRTAFRAGGATPDTVPGAEELAGSIDAALDRELPFRCAGALVHAISGPASYGFLNVLAATRACLDGGDTVAVLTGTDGDALLAGTDVTSLARTRRWFTGFGSADLLVSHDDLVEVGLISPT